MHTDATESTESTGTGVAWKAFKEAFPVTLPILAGFWFVAFAYGIYMHAEGFSFWYPFLMAACIFGGSLEFVTVAMLLRPVCSLSGTDGGSDDSGQTFLLWYCHVGKIWAYGLEKTIPHFYDVR